MLTISATCKLFKILLKPHILNIITIQEVSCNYKKKQFKNNSSPEDEEIGRKVLLGLKNAVSKFQVENKKRRSYMN